MAKKDFAAACPTLEEAYSLDHGEGTLLAMALCHEGNAKSATALREFRESVMLAVRAHRPDRVILAESHVQSLAATVPRIRIRFASPPAPGTAITLDGDRIDAATASAGLEVDPGAHEVAESAPGRLSWRRRVEVAAGSEPTVVDVRELMSASPLPVPDARPSPPKPSSSGRIWGLSLGAVGLVAVGVGSYFGAEAFLSEASSRSQCTGTQCSHLGVALNDEAKQDAVISDVTFAAAGAAILAGSLLLIFRRSPRALGAWQTPPYGAWARRTGFGVTASW
jgi:hypothetical protein